MEHNLFKPKSFEEGKHAVVGDCNNYTMQQRWELETPLFARAIIRNIKQEDTGYKHILDYGCGVGRIAKEIISNSHNIVVTCLDESKDMLTEARRYINDPTKCKTIVPDQLSRIRKGLFDLVYCVYVLQHVPAIQIREILSRLHYYLKDNGKFIYCSSNYRMAIRFDNGGFFDDRFLGVNLLEEIQRYFEIESELFTQEEIANNDILRVMVKDGMEHPAYILSKKPVTNYFFSSIEQDKVPVNKEDIFDNKVTIKKEEQQKNKLLLLNRLAPGDCLVMTNAIRDLHKAYPGKYLTEVRTPCNEIYQNNPYISKLSYDENEYQRINKMFSAMNPANMDKESRVTTIGDVTIIDMHYPLIHRSGVVGAHFSEGHREWLEYILHKKIPQTDIRPEIYLTDTEKNWTSQVFGNEGVITKYWVINAGSKKDYSLKQYPYYQEVVDLLEDKITFVQIGQKSHLHEPLHNAIDLVGKTGVRDLFRLIYHAEGVLTCVSFPMHIAAAFTKPCVVVAGGREGTRWELYPNQQFLYVNGCLPCANYDGCWKSKNSDCINKKNDIPVCMTLLRPEDVSRSIERYYEGGMLEYESNLFKQ